MAVQRLRGRERLIVALCLSSTVVAATLTLTSGVRPDQPLQQAIYYFPILMAVVSTVMSSRRNVARRAPITVLAIGLSCSGIAGLIYDYVDQKSTPTLIGGVSDLAYLAAGALLVTFAAWPPHTPRRLATTMDGLIAGTSIATIGVAILQKVMEGALGRALTEDVALGFVTMDIMCISLLTAMTLKYRVATIERLVVFVGLALTATGDVLFALSAAGVNTITSDVLDTMYLVGLTLFGVCSWAPGGRERAVVAPAPDVLKRPRSITLLPTIGSLVGLGVLIGAAVDTLVPLVAILAAITILLAIGRTLLATRELSTSLAHHREARTDDLTGILNRRAFLEQVAHALDRVAESNNVVAVCIVDLDAFKDVNDTLGHGAGDDVLQLISERLSAIEMIDSVARLGGDEFGLIVSQPSIADVLTTVHEIADVIAEPIHLGGLRMRIESSTGVAVAEPDLSVEEMIRRADVAMYAAKRGASRVTTYQADNDREDRDRLQQLDELRTALVSDQISIVVQPIVELATGRLTSVEALVRWHHPLLGVMRPDSFLRLAQQAGLLDDLTDIVVDLASDAHHQLRQAGHFCDVQINIEPDQAADREWIERTHARLISNDVDPSAVVFEITESAWASSVHDLSEAARRLRELGYRLSVDDFGVGASSLHRLVHLPIDQLKLDRSFTDLLVSSDRSRMVVGGLIDLAHSLDLQLVAEGVETVEVTDALRSLGCEYVQGYGICRPCSPGDLISRLAQQSGSPSRATPANQLPQSRSTDSHAVDR
jgi:diguanylate cyclase